MQIIALINQKGRGQGKLVQNNLQIVQIIFSN